MSVEQAIHELQEQLQRVPAGHQAMHQECALRSGGGYEVARPVGGAEDLDALPVGKEERAELENLVIIWRGTSSAQCNAEADEGRRELEAADRCDTPS